MRSGGCLAFVVWGTLLIPPAHASPDVRLPPGTRTEGDHLVSGRGLRDTTDFIAKELARRGLTVTQIGPTQSRGVELTRFIAQTPSTPWLAIHVLRAAGKTQIFFVPRVSLDEPRPHQ